jgi:WD40 repeat protein
LKVLDIINFENPIKFVKNVGNNLLLVSDLKNNFKLIDTANSFEVKQSIKIPNIPDAELHNNKIDVSYGAEYLGVEDSANKVVKVFDLQKKKGKFNIDWHKGRVETVAFDFQNKLLATGGQDGKSFIWSLDTGRMVNALPHHSDFVTAISFTKNGTRIATGSYDKKIIISNLYSMKKPIVLAGSHTNCIKFIYFISNGRLVSFDKDGVIVVWDYVTGRVIKTLKKTAAEPVAITFIFNFNFMLVGCKDDNIYLYDMEEYKLLQHDYLRIEEGIAEFAYIFDQGIFAIGTLRGAVILYNMKNDESSLEASIVNRNYEEAYKLVRENPILKYSDLYDRLEVVWEKTSQKASALLDKGLTDKAKMLFKPFMKVPGKNTYIRNILDDYVEFKRFKTLVENKKYQLAYSMVLSHETYKDSEIYQSMERDWKERVEKAKTILLKDIPNSEDLIQKLFADFRGISSKTLLIRSILTDKSALSMFNRKFRERSFDDCFRLSEKYAFIKDLNDYSRLLQYEDVLYNKMNMSLNKSEYKKTVEFARQLLGFPNYKSEASHIIKNIETTIAFRDHYTSKRYNEMLKLIAQHPFLETLDEYEEFNKDWYQSMLLAHTHASKGNIKGILQALSEYIDIEERLDAIGHVLSAGYVQQLNFIAKKESKNPFVVLDSINEYIKIFGMTDDLVGYLDYIESKHELTFMDNELDMTEESKQPSFNRWVTLDVVPEKIVYLKK